MLLCRIRKWFFVHLYHLSLAMGSDEWWLYLWLQREPQTKESLDSSSIFCMKSISFHTLGDSVCPHCLLRCLILTPTSNWRLSVVSRDSFLQVSHGLAERVNFRPSQSSLCGCLSAAATAEGEILGSLDSWAARLQTQTNNPRSSDFRYLPQPTLWKWKTTAYGRHAQGTMHATLRAWTKTENAFDLPRWLLFCFFSEHLTLI